MSNASQVIKRLIASIKTVAFSGSYNDLTDRPNIRQGYAAYIEDLGGIGDSTTDDTAAMLAVFAASKEVNLGIDKTYRVTTMPPIHGHTIYALNVKILVEDGTSVMTKPIYTSGAVIGKLQIIAKDTHPTSITSVVSITGSAPDYYATVALSNFQNAQVGDAIATIDTAISGVLNSDNIGHVLFRAGGVITAVDAPNKRITYRLKCWRDLSSFGIGTGQIINITSSTSYIVKCLVKFPNISGIVLTTEALEFGRMAILSNSDEYWDKNNVSSTEKGTHGLYVGGNTIDKVSGASVNPEGVGGGCLTIKDFIFVWDFDQSNVIAEKGFIQGDYICSANAKRFCEYMSTGGFMRNKHSSNLGGYLGSGVTDIGGSKYNSSLSSYVGSKGKGSASSQLGPVINIDALIAFNDTYGSSASNAGRVEGQRLISMYNRLGNIQIEKASSADLDGCVSRFSAEGLRLDQKCYAECQNATITNNTVDIVIQNNSLGNFTGTTYATLTSANNSAYFDTNGVYRGSPHTVSQLIIKPPASTNIVQLTPTSSGDALVLEFNGADAFVFRNNTQGFYPVQDNFSLCGRSGQAWNAVVSHSFLTVSDQNAKKEISDFSTALVNVVRKIKGGQIQPKVYKYKTQTDNIWQIGYIAQDLMAVFANEGLSAIDYGIIREESGVKFVCVDNLMALLNYKY